MFTAVAGANAKFIAEIGLRLLQKLSPHLDKFTGAAAETVSATAEVVTAAGDGGAAKATFNGRQFLTDLDILPDLSEFQTHLASLNGQVKPEQKGLVEQIIKSLGTGTGEISASQTRDLFRTVTEITLGDRVVGDTGSKRAEGAKPAVEPEPEKVVDEKDTTGSPQTNDSKNPGSLNDTDVVLENLLGFINTKLTKKNGHFYMALNWLGGPVNWVLEKLGWEFRLPSPEELPAKVQELIVNNKNFNDALRAAIENKEVDTSGMGFIQKRVLSGTKKLLNYLANNPDMVLDGAPQAGYAMKYGSGVFIPIVRKIPFVGGLLALAYPFLADELSIAGEIKEKEYLTNILNVLRKHHKTENPKPETAHSEAASESELAGAVL